LPPRLFVFSAADQAGLSRMSNAYKAILNTKLTAEKAIDNPISIKWSSFISNLAFTLESRRSALDHRTFAVSASASDLSIQLQRPLPAHRRTSKSCNVFFIFSGQGAQWASMGRELVSRRSYRQSLEKSQASLDMLGGTWSILEELLKPLEESRINSPAFSQPLCTALQIALVDLLKTWGVQPKAVVGHSSGEIGKLFA
jgi:acyl transferase domain-containing protein